MALIRIRGWQLFLIRVIVIPVLQRVSEALGEKAEKTPEEWDDLAVGAFQTVLQILKSGEIFEET